MKKKKDSIDDAICTPACEYFAFPDRNCPMLGGIYCEKYKHLYIKYHPCLDTFSPEEREKVLKTVR